MKPGMPYFQQLGDSIADAWYETLMDERAFPAIAEAALRKSPPHQFVDPTDVIEWGMTSRSIGQQHPEAADFGEPPLIVYRSRRFFIEVLFWFDGTTSIHQHGFDGAFCVLAGSSVHSRYDFRETDRSSTRVLFGDVEFRSAELLKQGDVHQILSADKFIHALFHLEHPSVSIVVRTERTPGGIQYSYLPPYVGFDPFDGSIFSRRARQFLRALRITSNPRAAELTRRNFEVLDDLGVLNGMIDLANWREAISVDVGEEEDEEEAPADEASVAAAEEAAAHKALVLQMYEAAYDAGKARFGKLWQPLMTSIEESMRMMSLVGARQRVRDPELRFFLALLMNVPDRTRLLELVRERFPAEDPVDAVLRWLRALSDGTTLEYELGDDTVSLLGFLIRGATAQEAAQMLAKLHGRDFSQDETRSVEETIADLAKIPIFQALLVTERAPRISHIVAS